MVDLKTLKASLVKLGVKPGMRLIVHTKFSAFGGVEGGPEGFIRTLMELLTPEGTLLMPTFTFQLYEGKDYGKPFDYCNSPSATGIVSETFRKMPGVYRSADPCHPTAAWGKDAKWFVEERHKVPTVSKDSPIGRLEQKGGHILMVSCEDSVTFMHVVEFTNHVPCLGCRTEEYDGILADGKQVKLRTWGWRKGTCTALDTPKIFQTMRGCGEMSEADVGNAHLSLFPCSAYRTAYEPLLAAHCPACPIRPRTVSRTVPTDWDMEKERLLSSDAFTGDLDL